jgi:NAD+--asparagine ADP-ribosyltransferase
LKVTITRGGGLAGISRQTELASDALPADDAATLHDQVAGSEWLEQETREAPQVHPDEMSYEVTVEDQGQTTTRRFTEQTLPESLRSLIAWVDARPERSQSIVR